MGTIALQIPQIGQPNATEAPKIAGDFTTLQNVINGNLDSNNIAASLGASAGVNTAGSTVKGVVSNAGPGTRTNVAYGALNDAADSVTVALPANGLIAVWYQGTWQESVSGAGSAAIFIGANQLKYAEGDGSPSALPNTQAAGINAPALATPLATFYGGLWSCTPIAGYTGDVTTGQIVGLQGIPALSPSSGRPPTSDGATFAIAGGPCYIFAAAGTYAVSVQFKASSGTVTASNRRLWVRVLSFA